MYSNHNDWSFKVAVLDLRVGNCNSSSQLGSKPNKSRVASLTLQCHVSERRWVTELCFSAGWELVARPECIIGCPTSALPRNIPRHSLRLDARMMYEKNKELPKEKDLPRARPGPVGASHRTVSNRNTCIINEHTVLHAYCIYYACGVHAYVQINFASRLASRTIKF